MKKAERPRAGFGPALCETHGSLYTLAKTLAMPGWEPRAMDKVKDIMIEALRHGASTPGEQRLYRSGKFPGLFASRTSVHAEAASQAVQLGLIEIVRTEAKGKTVVEWVRVNSKGVQFVLDHDSPVRAMDALHDLLKANVDGFPGWVDDLRKQVDDIGQRFMSEVESLRGRMEHLVDRVQEALKRADKYGPPPIDGAAGAIPWAHTVVDYLERRREGGIGEKCPLPELFSRVRDENPELTIMDFHSGLRRLHDRGSVRLWPCDNPDGPPEPEYCAARWAVGLLVRGTVKSFGERRGVSPTWRGDVPRTSG